MASAVATQKIRSKLKITGVDHDPGGTTAILAGPDGGTTPAVVDLSTIEHFAVMAMISVLAAGAITKLEIIASATSDMASAEVIKDSGAVLADANGDWVIEECSVEEIAQIGAVAGKALKYVCARITMSNAGSEAVVFYIGLPRAPRLDLTPATTIA
jgi:hypothetical protein